MNVDDKKASFVI